MFEISITNTKKRQVWGEKVCEGKITIGNFSEKFNIPVECWNLTEYYESWKRNIGRILNGKQTGCLMTKVRNPLQSAFNEGWPLYKDGKNVIVTNQIFIFKNLKSQFHTEAPYLHVGALFHIKGKKISKWKTTIDSLEKAIFLMHSKSIKH